MENTEPSHTRGRLKSEEPAQGRRLLLFFSLSLNVGLLLFLALFGLNIARPAIPRPGNTAQASKPVLTTHARRAAARAAVSPWSQLESTDLSVYAANLRAAGCPLKTTRDILLPLIEEKFELPETSVSEPTNFWASFSQRQAAESARARQESALEQQKNTMLQELLGFAWTSEGLKQAHAGETAGSVGFLDYDRAEKLLCIAERLKKQFSDNSRRSDRLSAFYQTWRREATEILSPAEFEETELRGILMLSQRRNPNLNQVGMSSSELRQLMAFKRDLFQPLPSALLAGGNEVVREPDWAGEQQLDAKARELLGDSRFINYLKSRDASIERTLVVLQNEHLPRSYVLQLFDFRQEAMARAQEIRQLPLSRAEKRVQLAALRQNALEQLATLSNSPLLKINQDWIQELANP